jgi:hypothetical protein
MQWGGLLVFCCSQMPWGKRNLDRPQHYVHVRLGQGARTLPHVFGQEECMPLWEACSRRRVVTVGELRIHLVANGSTVPLCLCLRCVQSPPHCYLLYM